MDPRWLWVAVPLLQLAGQFFKIEPWFLAPIWGFLTLFFARHVSGGGLQMGVMYATLYLVLTWGPGVVYGFERNPYGGTPTAALLNCVVFTLFAIAREFSRYVALSLGRWEWWIWAVSLVYAFDLRWLSPNPKLVGEVIIPAVAISVVSAHLQLRGGVFASLPLALAYGVLPYVVPFAAKAPWVLYGLLHVMFLVAVYIDMAQGALSRRDLVFVLGVIGLVAFVVGGFGVRPYVVATGSMMPVYHPGDVVLVVPARDAEVGDVILFRADIGLVLHRVIEKFRGDDGRWYYRTKGDANASPDPTPVPQEDLVGKAVFKIPQVGWIALWARDPAGGWPYLAALLALAATVERLVGRVASRLTGRRNRRFVSQR